MALVSHTTLSLWLTESCLLLICTGRGITRLRSLRMDRRLQEIEILPTNRVQYDYPTTQVHPYDVLVGPVDPEQTNSLGNYTTMQPAGSVREGAITPMGHSSHTLRSIYDDDVTSGEHGDKEYGSPDLVRSPNHKAHHHLFLSPQPPRPVQDISFYHVLEAPGQINGQPVRLHTLH